MQYKSTNLEGKVQGIKCLIVVSICPQVLHECLPWPLGTVKYYVPEPYKESLHVSHKLICLVYLNNNIAAQWARRIIYNCSYQIEFE